MFFDIRLNLGYSVIEGKRKFEIIIIIMRIKKHKLENMEF